MLYFCYCFVSLFEKYLNTMKNVYLEITNKRAESTIHSLCHYQKSINRKEKIVILISFQMGKTFAQMSKIVLEKKSA